LQNPQIQSVYLNGQPNPQYKNPAGLSSEDIQTYLNGAIDRTKSEMRMYTDNKNLENDVRWSQKMAEQEIQFKRELFQREVEAERERMARERKEFDERKAKIEEEYEISEEDSKRELIHILTVIPEKEFKNIGKIKLDAITIAKKINEKFWIHIMTPIDIWNLGLDAKFEIL
jgi:hypothetical protein